MRAVHVHVCACVRKHIIVLPCALLVSWLHTVFYCYLNTQSTTPPQLRDILSEQKINNFLSYLKNHRKCGPGTVANYCQSLQRSLAYFKNEEPEEVQKAVERFRGLVRRCQRIAETTRDTTNEQLQSKGKWLNW